MSGRRQLFHCFLAGRVLVSLGPRQKLCSSSKQANKQLNSAAITAKDGSLLLIGGFLFYSGGMFYSNVTHRTTNNKTVKSYTKSDFTESSQSQTSISGGTGFIVSLCNICLILSKR